MPLKRHKDERRDMLTACYEFSLHTFWRAALRDDGEWQMMKWMWMQMHKQTKTQTHTCPNTPTPTPNTHTGTNGGWVNAAYAQCDIDSCPNGKHKSGTASISLTFQWPQTIIHPNIPPCTPLPCPLSRLRHNNILWWYPVIVSVNWHEFDIDNDAGWLAVCLWLLGFSSIPPPPLIFPPHKDFSPAEVQEQMKSESNASG